MSRARNIKPSFFTNDTLAECEPLARLLFAGMWTICDREGRLEDRPRKIKAEVLPYDTCDADFLINQLSEHGFLLRYEVNGTNFIQILNFVKHQNPHIKEAASIIPAPVEHGASTVQNVPYPPSPIPLPDSPILNPREAVTSSEGKGYVGAFDEAGREVYGEQVWSGYRPWPKPKDLTTNAKLASLGSTPDEFRAYCTFAMRSMVERGQEMVTTPAYFLGGFAQHITGISGVVSQRIESAEKIAEHLKTMAEMDAIRNRSNGARA